MCEPSNPSDASGFVSCPDRPRHLLFRDFLRASPGAAGAYADTKRAAATRYRAGRIAYNEAKTDFFLDLLGLANERASDRRAPRLSTAAHQPPPAGSLTLALMERRFCQVDVFGTRPYTGNPLAVVVDGQDLADHEMQQLARWTNLSETAFLLPPTTPDADYRVRIFTLAGELPFAGHPTLGSCHAWLETGGQPRRPDTIIQECGAGPIRLHRTGEMLAFAAPPLVRSGPVEEELLDAITRVLGVDRTDVVDSQWVDNGPGWVGLLLRDAAAVLAVEPQSVAGPLGSSLDVGLVGFLPPGSDCAIEVRALFSDERGDLREDPVTGSLNASLAQWLLGTRRLQAPYIASQGTRLGRVGRPRIDQDPDGTVWVGGSTFTCISGIINI